MQIIQLTDYLTEAVMKDYNTENMNTVFAPCRKFSRRNDFDVFSMSTYMSCENCRHLNGENQCEKKLEEGRNKL